MKFENLTGNERKIIKILLFVHFREVVHIKCNGLECGRRPAYVNQDSLARNLDDMSSSLHGDWPWHVALYKNGQHVCDGTLIDDQWIMTTSSCFQG